MALTPAVPGAPLGLLDLRRARVDHRRLVAQMFASSMGESDSDEGIDEQEELRTLIHCAASQDNATCVAILLAGGVSCNLQDRFGRTPLHWAAEQGSMDVFGILGEIGASVDVLSRRGNTPLMLAAERGHEGIVRVLVQAGAGYIDRHEMGLWHLGWFRSTPLHSAAKGGSAGVAGILLGAGFHREQRNERGFTAAEVSALQRQPVSPAVTRLLLPVQDGGGQLVYDRVNRIAEDAEVVRGLVRGGAFVDWQDANRGETPLHRAVHFRHMAILKILLRAGANPSLRDHVGGSPLHMAAVTGATAAAEALLGAGAETETRTMGSYCPLHLAVASGRVGVVKLLLSAGACIERQDLNHGASPLSLASRLGRTPVLHALLEAGANVEARCAFAGLTCLQWACRTNRACSVDALLQAGADLDAVDGTGMNAYSMIGVGTPADSSIVQVDNAAELRRLSDPESAGLIRRALDWAKRDRAWDRRGWLVVLAKRRGLMGMPVLVGSKVKGESVEVAGGVSTRARPAVAATTTAAATGMDQGNGAVRRKRSRQQQRVGEDAPGASAVPPELLLYSGHEQDDEVMPPNTDAYKDLDGVEDALVQRDATSFRGGGDPAENGVIPLWTGTGAVGALLRVAAIEAGVFRNVISFI